MSKGIEIIGKDWSREQNVEEIGFDPEENDDENIRVVKSGTDFRELSMIAMDIERDEEGKCHIGRIQGNTDVSKCEQVGMINGMLLTIKYILFNL